MATRNNKGTLSLKKEETTEEVQVDTTVDTTVDQVDAAGEPVVETTGDSASDAGDDESESDPTTEDTAAVAVDPSVSVRTVDVFGKEMTWDDLLATLDKTSAGKIFMEYGKVMSGNLDKTYPSKAEIKKLTPQLLELIQALFLVNKLTSEKITLIRQLVTYCREFGGDGFLVHNLNRGVGPVYGPTTKAGQKFYMVTAVFDAILTKGPKARISRSYVARTLGSNQAEQAKENLQSALNITMKN